MKTRSLALLVITILCSSPMGKAFADWSAGFQPPTADKPELLITVPDLDVSVLTTLAIELDGIDITSYLSFDGRGFLYTPVEPLEKGEHRLRLMIINPDGSTNEKAHWSFSVSNTSIDSNNSVSNAQQIANAESWLRSASFAADTLTEFSHRFSQRNIENAPDRSIVSGSGNVHGVLQGENWTVDTKANYLLQSDKDLRLTGNAADIGEYTIAADYAGDKFNTGFTLGHHDVGLESLLFSSFQRRGASVRGGTLDNRIAANLFSFRPETQTGVRDFTGLSDSNNRLEGASVSLKPFSSNSDALKVTGVYYDGSGSTGGIGISGEDEISTGSGWGAILEKNMFQGKVAFRGEYAHSLYDADGDASLAPEDSSDAMSLVIEARPFDNPVFFDKQADIVFGTRYERIDTFFASLGNQGLAADRDAITVYNILQWGGLSNNLQLAHETNNVDDLVGLPADRLRSIAWDSNYAFDPQTRTLDWLGSPYLNVSGFLARLDRDKTPTGYEGADTDNTTRSLTFGGGSSYERWYWSASHTYSDFYDHTGIGSDTVNNLSSLGAGWTVSERLSINSNLQYGTFKDKADDATSYNTNVTLGLRSVLVRDKLNLNLDYNLNLAGGSDDSPDKHIINGEIEWAIRQARRNHPGFTFAIRGSMETTNGKTSTSSTSDETQYQVFAVLRISAPLSAGF